MRLGEMTLEQLRRLHDSKADDLNTLLRARHAIAISGIHDKATEKRADIYTQKIRLFQNDLATIEGYI